MLTGSPKCPLEINLVGGDGLERPWSCKITLVRKYSFERTADASQLLDTSNHQPLGPWISQPPELLPFATVTSTEGMQDALRWAQLATLNPGNRYEIYRPGDNRTTPDTIQVRFSPNIVRFDISGPTLPNLSFYDIPEIIIEGAEEPDEDYMARFFQNLAEHYVHVAGCINLLVLPITDSAAESCAAKIVDRSGARRRTFCKPGKRCFEDSRLDTDRCKVF